MPAWEYASIQVHLVSPYMRHSALCRHHQGGSKDPGGACKRPRWGEPASLRRQRAGKRPLPPLPAALPRSRCQPRAPSQRASQRGSGGGGGGGPRAAGRGRRRGEGGRKGSREGGREERRTQRAPGSWSFCSAWPGFNAQQQRAAAAAGSPGAPAAAEPAAAPLPAPCKLCEPPGGPGARPGSSAWTTAALLAAAAPAAAVAAITAYPRLPGEKSAAPAAPSPGPWALPG